MNFSTLLLLGSIVVPAVVSILLFCGYPRSENLVSRLGYLAFGFPCIAGVLLFLQFDSSVSGYCFEFLIERMGLHELGITFHLGLNGVSSPLFAMAGIVGLGAGLAAIHSGAERMRLYLALLALMQSGLMGLFASVDLFFYYLFHEFALIPTFIMIGLWGGRNRRSISLEITIYLTLGALISLCGLVALNAMVDSPKFDFPSLSSALAETSLSSTSAKTIFGLLLFGFGILVALFPFHTWAPRGYEAAPTSVSMLHAGVLKKFGLYGLVQIAAPLLPETAFEWSEIILWLALGNVIFVGFVTLAQNNLKSMIGYGSVMHMGYCFLGIGACSALGAGSAVMLMCAHGLSVALMFLLAQFIYRRTGTYEMNEMGGLASRTPILACFLVAATLATIGLPGFGNFWGEFGVFLSLGEMTENRFFLGLAALGIIISAIFGLRAVARTLYGSPSEELEKHLEKNSPIDLSRGELLSSGVILAALTLIGLFPSAISERIDGEIGYRYAVFKDVQESSGRPSCCPIKGDTKDSADADKQSILTNP